MAFFWIKNVLFALVLTGPMVGLLCLGGVAPYGNKGALPKFPSVAAVLSAKKGSLDALGEALIKRSAITVYGIRMKNNISYNILGYVDTPEIVSGSGGWLFYKGELRTSCLTEKQVRKSLAQLDLIADLASAAGVDTVISISPDKASIYPEYLSLLARRYWGCRASDSALLRRLIGLGGTTLDHAEPILIEKRNRPRAKLYYLTDTHWTPYAAGLALRQLLAAVFPRTRAADPPRLTGLKAEKVTDMGSRMLLLGGQEEYDAIDEKVEASLVRFNDSPSRKTIIVHDSFYGILRDHLSAIFPQVQMVHLESGAATVSKAVVSADRLIVNTVERSLLRRTEKGNLSWRGGLIPAILRRNAARARSCEGFVAAAIGKPNRLHNVTITQKGWTGTGDDPQIVVNVPRVRQSMLCLRLVFESAANQGLEVFLPARRNNRSFQPGRSIPIQAVGGLRTFDLVLPSSAAGGLLRVDPGPGSSASVFVRSIEFGILDEGKPRG